MFRARFTSRTSAKQTLAIFFFGGADFCVSALSFSFFGFVLFNCLFFFQAVIFAYCFFRGLILAPDELRTNSERTLALRFFLELIFFGVELFGFWSYKNTGITAC